MPATGSDPAGNLILDPPWYSKFLEHPLNIFAMGDAYHALFDVILPAHFFRFDEAAAARAWVRMYSTQSCPVLDISQSVCMERKFSQNHRGASLSLAFLNFDWGGGSQKMSSSAVARLFPSLTSLVSDRNDSSDLEVLFTRGELAIDDPTVVWVGGGASPSPGEGCARSSEP